MKVVGLCLVAFAGCTLSAAAAGPTGLNVIPTTDIVPLDNWIFGLQNANTSFTGLGFYRQPLMTEQSPVWNNERDRTWVRLRSDTRYRTRRRCF